MSKVFGFPRSTILAYAAGIAIVALITLLGLPVRPFVNPTNLAMLYLLGVVIAALRWGRGPAVLVAMLSMLVLDIVFVPPHFDLVIDDAPSLLAFVGLSVVALVIGTLAARAREQAQAAQRRERLTAASYHLSVELASAADREAILHALTRHIRQISPWNVAFFLAGEEGIDVVQATEVYHVSAEGHETAARLLSGQAAVDPAAGFLVQAQTCYLPLRSGQESIGVLGLQPSGGNTVLPIEQRQLLWAFANQAALALERAQLAEQARKADMMQVAEHLQAALLNSISHNLRTPLSSIAGTLSSLQEPEVHFDDDTRRELIATAWQDANHLNQLVGNLLDMSRLESGVIRVQRELCDVQDLIGVALSEMRERLDGRRVETHIPEELALVPMDFVLMVQVLVNLLDNAVKYSPPGSPITMRAQRTGAAMQISVTDCGKGIAPQEQTRIFEKFYRGQHRDDVGGMGMGLSIVKGLVHAHGGEISLHAIEGEETTFTVSLPVVATTTETGSPGQEEDHGE